MKTFQTLQELLDHVPQCIICGKDMNVHLDGHLRQWYQDGVHFKFEMKDGLLCSKKHKKYSVIIEPKSNLILEGQEVVNNLMVNWITVYKTCWTCKCTVSTRYNSGHRKKTDVFPPLSLTGEELSYTLRRGKSVDISQTYYDDSSLLGVRTNIVVNHRMVTPRYFDFSKYKNLEQVNNRIATILTFS